MEQLRICVWIGLAMSLGCGSDPDATAMCESSADCASGDCVESRCVAAEPREDAGGELDSGPSGLDQLADAGTVDADTADATEADGAVVTDASPDADLIGDATLDAYVDAYTDAGTTLDAHVDATRDSAAPGGDLCSHYPTAFACDDFESLAFPWESRETRGDIEIMRGDAAFGVGFARAIARPSGEALFFHDFEIEQHQDVYFRAYMRTSVRRIENVAVLVQLESVPFDDKVSLDFGHQAQAHLVGPHPAAVFGGPETFPTEDWACVEFDLTFQGMVGTMTLRIDGAEIGSDTVPPAPILNRIGFGIISNLRNRSSFEVDFDNLVVDRSPIGCMD